MIIVTSQDCLSVLNKTAPRFSLIGLICCNIFANTEEFDQPAVLYTSDYDIPREWAFEVADDLVACDAKSLLIPARFNIVQHQRPSVVVVTGWCGYV